MYSHNMFMQSWNIIKVLETCLKKPSSVFNVLECFKDQFKDLESVLYSPWEWGGPGLLCSVACSAWANHSRGQGSGRHRGRRAGPRWPWWRRWRSCAVLRVRVHAASRVQAFILQTGNRNIGEKVRLSFSLLGKSTCKLVSEAGRWLVGLAGAEGALGTLKTG